MTVDPSSTITKRPANSARSWVHEIPSGAWWAIMAGFLGWTFEVFDLNLWPSTLPVLLKAFSMTKQQAGAVTSIAAVGAIIGGISLGVVADAIGRVKTLYLSILIYSIFSAAVALSPSLTMLTVFRFLGGVGMGGTWSAGAALIAEVVPENHRGKGGTIMQAGLPIGGMLSSAAVVWVTQLTGGLHGDAWRYLYWLGAAPALILLPVALRTPESAMWRQQRLSPAPKPEGAKPRRMVNHRLFIALGFIFCMQFVLYAVTTWFPTYLVQVKKLTFVSSLNFTFSRFFGYLIGFIVLGLLIDRLPRRAIFLIYLAIAGVALAWTALTTTPLALLIASIVLGFGFGGIYGCIGPWTAEMLGATRHRASGMAIAYNGGRCGGLIAPILIGWMAGFEGGFTGGMFLTVGVMALAATVITLAPEAKGAKLD